MTAILPFLLKLGPWLIAAVGVLFGLFRHQQAKADIASAKAQRAARRAGAGSRAQGRVRQAPASSSAATQGHDSGPDSGIAGALGTSPGVQYVTIHVPQIGADQHRHGAHTGVTQRIALEPAFERFAVAR